GGGASMPSSRGDGRAPSPSGVTIAAATGCWRRSRPSRALSAQRRVLGFRDGPGPRLALDAVRAVLRGRGYLLRLRHGDRAGAADAPLLWPARLHQGEAP